MKTFKFKIDRSGNLTVLDVVGGGTGCVEATSSLERRLGNADESTRAHTESFVAEPQELTIAQQ